MLVPSPLLLRLLTMAPERSLGSGGLTCFPGLEVGEPDSEVESAPSAEGPQLPPSFTDSLEAQETDVRGSGSLLLENIGPPKKNCVGNVH